MRFESLTSLLKPRAFTTKGYTFGVTRNIELIKGTFDSDKNIHFSKTHS